MMKALFDTLDKLIQKLLIVMMAGIVLTVSWQVFSRFVLNSPSSFTEELSRYLLIWIGILGAAYAYKTKAHLGLDLFVEKLTPSNKRLVSILAEGLVIVFASAVLIYGGLSLVSLTLELEQKSAALGLQMGWIYSVIPVSGVLIVRYATQNIIQLLAEKG